MRRGDYYSGFAPRDGSPRWPALWCRCTGAWCPSLGPTGVSLLDWGADHSNGTLTNFTASSAFTVRSGAYSLYQSAANDYVAVSGCNNFSGQYTTVAFWCFATAWPSGTFVFFGTTTGGSKYWQIAGSGAAAYIGAQLISPVSPAVPLNAWTHVAMTNTPSASAIWVNGVAAGSGAAHSSVPTGVKTIAIGDWAGGLGSSFHLNGYWDDVRLYDRALSSQEIQLLATRRGIAYELQPRAATCLADDAALAAAFWRTLQMHGGLAA